MESEIHRQAVLLGNEAIARGLIEAGCNFVTSYPGTPSSEILPAVIHFIKDEKLSVYANWAVNEKIAFDQALAASYTGKRAAVVMKQVGLNVASDSLMSAAYTGVIGGFVIISADDPGPQSSQTEQDSRLFAFFAKIPVFDPSTPLEAMSMLHSAFLISEKYEIPVMLRPSLRICHARMNVPITPIEEKKRISKFKKDPHRWAATPYYRYFLHRKLNEKLQKIQQDFNQPSELNYVLQAQKKSKKGIIASGISFSIITDILNELQIKAPFDIFKVGTPYPLPQERINDFVNAHDQILVLEDTDCTIEIQIKDRSRVRGRLDGTVPLEGELVPEIVYQLLSNISEQIPQNEGMNIIETDLSNHIKNLNIPSRRPTLCPGCGHRSAMYAMRKAFPQAIFTSDIGCYTLGINLGAVDTILDMGAGLTLATGMYHAYKQDGQNIPIIATMGDSTFFHSGIPALVDAIYSNARFVFVLLDNGVTAMTGMQPTPALGILADGTKGNEVDLVELVRGCGVKYLKIIDPYQVNDLIELIKKANEYIQKPDGGMAVIIARHPCLIHYHDLIAQPRERVIINDKCDGCKYCIIRFECPALIYNEYDNKVSIDEKLCAKCAVCLDICPREAIEKAGE